MGQRTLIAGVLGDIHNIGLRVLEPVLEEEGFKFIYIGARLSHEDFINAALETDADAILISSSYGMAQADAEGLREKCREAGLEDILLYIGGNLVVTQQSRDWEEIKSTFKELGFDRVYGSSVDPKDVADDLRADLGLQTAG